MGRRNKLDRFADNEKRPNVIEPGKDLYEKIKGHWRDLYFKNDLPIVVEIGCGKGEYTIGLSRDDQAKNYIGVDIKGERIWYGSASALEEGLTNVAFLRTRVEQIGQFFEDDEVDEIWITFPGPRPKKSQAHRRLTATRFLESYKKMLKKDGVIHLKTDSDLMFEYTLEILADRSDVELLESVYDVYAANHWATAIQTRFEKKFMATGKTIKYLRFRFIPGLTKRSIFTIITSLFKDCK
ncbi:tRNA (guanosine(46)-N7)-methyltransferase TrmB [Candidatus Uhrbacteria bacterium]|jgi:tRNA (guanine-N7-)-methyltransferase|nr:tRNA (guanosine(46)-N7)-methyltransferase TrmB [Candidatus Uhrbacteria bacterium]